MGQSGDGKRSIKLGWPFRKKNVIIAQKLELLHVNAAPLVDFLYEKNGIGI